MDKKTEKSLATVAKSVELESITLQSSSVNVREGFHIKYEGKTDFAVNFLDQPESISILDVTHDKQKKSIVIFLHKFRAGIFKGQTEDLEKMSQDELEEHLLCEIEVKFNASYVVIGKVPKKEDLEVFAHINVPFTLWAYWREFLQSTFSRCNLPQIPLPMRHYGAKIAGKEK